jgi:hypothetical protein
MMEAYPVLTLFLLMPALQRYTSITTWPVTPTVVMGREEGVKYLTHPT